MNDQNDFKGIASASSKVRQAIKSRRNLPLNKKFLRCMVIGRRVEWRFERIR